MRRDREITVKSCMYALSELEFPSRGDKRTLLYDFKDMNEQNRMFLQQLGSRRLNRSMDYHLHFVHHGTVHLM